jgi:hypothetical protein
MDVIPMCCYGYSVTSALVGKLEGVRRSLLARLRTPMLAFDPPRQIADMIFWNA